MNRKAQRAAERKAARYGVLRPLDGSRPPVPATPKRMDKLRKQGALILPPPGLQGDYQGTCIACFRGTDTALGVRGEPEWHAAFLHRLGLPMDQAIAIVERRPEARTVRADGQSDGMYRVCSECAAKANFPAPVLAIEGAALPTIAQP